MGKRFNFIILVTLLFHFCNGLIPTAHGQSLVFGPAFFPDDRGSSQQIVRSFSVQNVNQKFMLSIQTGGGNEKRAGRGIIEINGEPVALLEIGKQFRMSMKPVSLQHQNDISIAKTGEDGASIIVTIMSTEKHAMTDLVPPIGKEANLAGYASIVFPAGTFGSAQHVMIYTSASASVNDLFESYATGPRLPYEVRIGTGDKAPGKDIEVELNIPESFFSSPYQIHIFARMHDNPDAPEKHERFFMIGSSVDEVTHMVRTTLPRHAFSTRFGKNGTYEAVIIVGLIQ